MSQSNGNRRTTHNPVTVSGKMLFMWRLAPQSQTFYLGLSTAQQLLVKGNLWRQIDAVVNLDQIYAWDEVEIETDNYHKPEAEIARQVRKAVEALSATNNRALSTLDSAPTIFGYNKHTCTMICCDHGYVVTINAFDGDPNQRPWIIGSTVYREIVAEIHAVLVWESPFPPEWRVQSAGIPVKVASTGADRKAKLRTGVIKPPAPKRSSAKRGAGKTGKTGARK